jgi:hypothetical protein
MTNRGAVYSPRRTPAGGRGLWSKNDTGVANRPPVPEAGSPTAETEVAPPRRTPLSRRPRRPGPAPAVRRSRRAGRAAAPAVSAGLRPRPYSARPSRARARPGNARDRSRPPAARPPTPARRRPTPWIALSPPERASSAARVGVAFNLLLVVAGLSLLTVIWWTTAWFLFAIAWAQVVLIVLLWYGTLSLRGQGGRGPFARRCANRVTTPAACATMLSPEAE